VSPLPWLRLSLVAVLFVCSCSRVIPTPTAAHTSTHTPTRPPTPLLPRPVATELPTGSPEPTRVIPPTLVPSAVPTRAVTPTRPPTQYPLPSGRSECSEQQVRSAVLGESLSLSLYLPVGYFDQTQRRYPVVYLLSCLGGNHREWVVYGVCSEMDGLIRNGDIQPMIIAMPSGNDNPADGIGSYWFNHAPPPLSDGKRWGDYIWQDVVRYIDSKYRTLPRRASRAIGGLSAGGQGALTLALTHPEVLSTVGARSPSFRRADGSIAGFGDPAYYNQYDPIWLVQNTQTWQDLTIWIDDGDADNQWGAAIREYHAMLVTLGIPHTWHVFPGTHDPTYWSPLVPTYLKWYNRQLEGQ